MSTVLWLLIAVAAVLVVGVGVVLYSYKKSGRKHETDYYGFFWIGLVWTIFGAVSFLFYEGMQFFFILGLVFLAIGAGNKDKWKKRKLSKQEKKAQMIAVAVGIIVFVSGALALFFVGL